MQVNLLTKQKQTHRHKKKKNLWLPKRKGSAGGIIRSMGLTDTNYYT